MAFTKKQEQFLSALKEHLGIVSKASDACGIHRNNHYNWIKASEEYKIESESIIEDCIDVVENALMEKILEGDTTAIIFFLKTKAKKRGYIEKFETESIFKMEQITGMNIS